MKRSFVLLSLVILLSSCVFDTRVVTPEPTTRTIIAEPYTPAPGEVTPTPPAMPTSTAPTFFDAHIALSPSGAGQERFPSATREIFAVWNYRNMREGLVIKREWYLNDSLWLEREEPWDFAKHSASGSLAGTSIYDFDNGLPAGKYKLIIYVDGVAQPIGKPVPEAAAQPFLEFEILPLIEAVSPNGQWKATSSLQQVTLADASGNQSELVAGTEIVSLAWLDNQHLFYVDRDRSQQIAEPLIGVRDNLWVIDILAHESTLLFQNDVAMGISGGLYPSPNGNYIASLAGSGFGDVCFLEARVVFFGVANDFKSVSVIWQDQFAGIPVLIDQSLYPTSVGIWKNNTQYEVYLNQTCSTDQSASGMYTFDLVTKSVAR